MALGFLYNLPLAIVIISLTLSRVPESRNEYASRILDWHVAILAAAGLGAVTYALIEASAGVGAVGWVWLAW